MKRIEQEQAAVWQQVPDADKAMVAKRGTFGGRNVYGPLLVLLKADKLAVLVRLAVRVEVWTRGPWTRHEVLCYRIGDQLCSTRVHLKEGVVRSVRDALRALVSILM